MAGTVEAFENTGGSSTTREVLFLIPELLFLAFMAVVAVNSGISFVASIRSGGGRSLRTVGKPSGTCGTQRRRPFRKLLRALAFAVLLAATVVPVLLVSLSVVLEAPAAVVITAAAAAAATMAVATVASVLVVATALAAVGASVLVLARIYGTFKKATTN